MRYLHLINQSIHYRWKEINQFDGWVGILSCCLFDKVASGLRVLNTRCRYWLEIKGEGEGLVFLLTILLLAITWILTVDKLCAICPWLPVYKVHLAKMQEIWNVPDNPVYLFIDFLCLLSASAYMLTFILLIIHILIRIRIRNKFITR